MKYNGPVTHEAAQAYLEEAKEALGWVVDAHSEVEKAHFNFDSGELVIQMQRSGSLLAIPVSDIMARFNSDRLYVSGVKVMNSRMTITVLTVANNLTANEEGRTRFFALIKTKVFTGQKAKEKDVIDDARKAFPSDRVRIFDPFKH